VTVVRILPELFLGSVVVEKTSVPLARRSGRGAGGAAAATRVAEAVHLPVAVFGPHLHLSGFGLSLRRESCFYRCFLLSLFDGFDGVDAEVLALERRDEF
jgi:hypothetical protein